MTETAQQRADRLLKEDQDRRRYRRPKPFNTREYGKLEYGKMGCNGMDDHYEGDE